jgi:septum formation protein
MALWLADAPLVLASRSEIRRKILSAAAIPLEIAPADIDERALEARAQNADPGAVAALLAREKALAAARVHRGRLVLGADQTLAFGPRLLSKPADIPAARAQLAALRGQTHALHAAVALVRDDAVLFEHHDLARLTMRDFSDAFLDAYIGAAGAEVTASVGAYQLEGAGIHLFERVEGDYFTILGLPLLPLLRHLRQAQHLAA